MYRRSDQLWEELTSGVTLAPSQDETTRTFLPHGSSGLRKLCFDSNLRSHWFAESFCVKFRGCVASHLRVALQEAPSSENSGKIPFFQGPPFVIQEQYLKNLRKVLFEGQAPNHQPPRPTQSRWWANRGLKKGNSSATVATPMSLHPGSFSWFRGLDSRCFPDFCTERKATLPLGGSVETVVHNVQLNHPFLRTWLLNLVS